MTSQRSADVSHYLTGVVYAVGFLFVLLPLADTFAQVWPPSFGNPGWRYGTVGLGANYLISVLFGMLLMTLVANFRWHRRTLTFLGILDLVMALVALLGTMSFLLDAAQVRMGVPRDNMQALRIFDIGAEKAVFKYLLSEVVLVWMGVASWRAAKAIPHTNVDEDVPKLVSQRTEKR
jgi:hypothetical protein